MTPNELKLIIEALLLSSAEPIDRETLLGTFEEWNKPDKPLFDKIIKELQQDYTERSIELKQVASGYCFQTKAQYSLWISKLQGEKPPKYSRALLETMAIIAYQQPVTRADIEEIRGVATSSSILKTLLERNWIKVAGHRDVPGKPTVYITTKEFLNYFSLNSLQELPSLPAVER